MGNLFCQTTGTGLTVSFFAAIPIHPACSSSALLWINNHFALASPGAISLFVNPVLPSSRGYQKPAQVDQTEYAERATRAIPARGICVSTTVRNPPCVSLLIPTVWGIFPLGQISYWVSQWPWKHRICLSDSGRYPTHTLHCPQRASFAAFTPNL